MRPDFLAWWEQAKSPLLQWSVDDLRALLVSWKVAPRQGDMTFLSGWLERLRALR